MCHVLFFFEPETDKTNQLNFLYLFLLVGFFHFLKKIVFWVCFFLLYIEFKTCVTFSVMDSWMIWLNLFLGMWNQQLKFEICYLVSYYERRRFILVCKKGSRACIFGGAHAVFSISDFSWSRSRSRYTEP